MVSFYFSSVFPKDRVAISEEINFNVIVLVRRYCTKIIHSMRQLNELSCFYNQDKAEAVSAPSVL